MAEDDLETLFDPSTVFRELERAQGPNFVFRVISGSDYGDILAKYFRLKGSYDGDDPKTMMAIYDAIPEDPRCLQYGIEGFNALGRNLESLLGLNHPFRLVEYLAAEGSIEELKEALNLFERAVVPKKNRFLPDHFKIVPSLEELSAQVISIGTALISQVGYVTLDEWFNSPEERRDEIFLDLETLRAAYSAMARAAQNLGNKGAVVEYLKAYNETGDGYEHVRDIEWETLEAVAATIWGMDKPWDGKTVLLEADLNRIKRCLENSERLSFHLLYGLRHVLPIVEEASLQDNMTTEPEYADDDFLALGITREMEWSTAYRTYWDKLKSMGTASMSLSGGGPSSKQMADFVNTWRRLQPFYIAKREALEVQQAE